MADTKGLLNLAQDLAKKREKDQKSIRGETYRKFIRRVVAECTSLDFEISHIQAAELFALVTLALYECGFENPKDACCRLKMRSQFDSKRLDYMMRKVGLVSRTTLTTVLLELANSVPEYAIEAEYLHQKERRREREAKTKRQANECDSGD